MVPDEAVVDAVALDELSPPKARGEDARWSRTGHVQRALQQTATQSHLVCLRIHTSCENNSRGVWQIAGYTRADPPFSCALSPQALGGEIVCHVQKVERKQPFYATCGCTYWLAYSIEVDN